MLIGITPLLMLSVYVYNERITDEKKTLYDTITTTSKLQAKSVTSWLEDRKKIVENIAKSSPVITSTKELVLNEDEREHEFEIRLELMKKLYANIHSYNWLDEFDIIDQKKGKVVFHSGKTSISSGMINDKCYSMANKMITCATDIYPSSVPILNEEGVYEAGVPTLLIFSPIEGEVEIEGILIARVNALQISPTISDYLSQYQSADGYLVNSKGYFLSKPETIMKEVVSGIKKRPQLEISQISPLGGATKIFQLADRLKTNWDIDGYQNYRGKTVVGAISPVIGTDWYYIVEISKQEVYSKVNNIQAAIMFFIAFVTTCTIVTTIFFARSLVKPIKVMTKTLLSANSQHLREIEIRSSDEFGQLIMVHNSLIRSLRESVMQLQSLEKKYRTLYETSPEMHRTIDVNGFILDVNNAYAKALGYSKEEIIGKSIFDHVDKNNVVALNESFLTWKKDKYVQNREIWLKRKDGTTFPCLLSASAIYDEDGNLVGSNTVLKDMREVYNIRKELEEIKIKRLLTIGELSARIAHDLRNPLAVVKNAVDLIKIRNPDMDQRTRELLRTLDRAVIRITHQVDDVLDFVMPKSLHLRSIRLSQILHDSLERIPKLNTIKINLPENDLEIHCDAEKMEIVFVNLITNAMQAMNNKGQIDIRTREESGYTIIEIEDTGPGIPKELIPKIFEPLFTTRQIGTGLGLPSCKSIIEKHGGKIEVESILGKYTKFTIKIPKTLVNQLI